MLEPLRSLTGLRRLALQECRLAIVPPQLSVLRQLEELDFSRNTLREPLADNICGPLAQLVSLTRLQLSRCALSALRPQLRSLKQLRALDLSGNLLLGEAVYTEWAPLEGLPALKSLDLRKCELEVRAGWGSSSVGAGGRLPSIWGCGWLQWGAPSSWAASEKGHCTVLSLT